MVKNFFCVLAVLGLAMLGGCASQTPYNKLDPLSGGYWEQHHENGIWEVDCHGGKPGFAEDCAAYRCAEFTFEKGYRYFVVLKADDESGESYGQQTGFAGASGVYQGQVNYFIKIYKQKPEGKKVVDAYKVLNTTPVPGSEEPYTVKQRIRDRKREAEN